MFCSFYLQNNCTDECPSGLVNNSNSICGEFLINIVMQKVQCHSYKYLSYNMHTYTHSHVYTLYIHTHTVCPPLTLGNGTVSYSMEMGVERNVGSVATHTCIPGYRLLTQDGGNTRTCNINAYGWSGQDFICGE